MFIRRRNPLDPLGGTETPESYVLSRRRALKVAGGVAGVAALGGGGYAGWQWFRGSDAEVIERGNTGTEAQQGLSRFFPAAPDRRFTYGRPETVEAEAARYTNFYEFSSFKSSWRNVGKFKTEPWTITVSGLCRNAFKLDIGDFMARYASRLVERQYRLRCVETWAMAIPWTGIELGWVLKDADPLPAATHVRFVSFDRPSEAPGMAGTPEMPWPYTEGLTLAEAANELVLLATGMYGHPLLKQHGAPVRLVVPWKYGYKSIKSIERIELVKSRPATFWTTLDPEAYPFQSNVEPDVPRPWPQDTERMLGTGDVFPTQLYNGYGQYVANLYVG
ncbi:MAG: protein-methionine-sulfoxide reductase catalytic subunit MsrP [Pirellulales bacterium]